MRDYEDLAPPLEVPIRRKTYIIPPVPATLGLQLMLAGDGDEDALRELENLKGTAFTQALLGDAYDQMVADNVPLGAMNRAFITALADFRFGRETALEVWDTGKSPEFLAALMAAAEAEALKSETSTAAVSKTPGRASTSGTTSRRATSAPRKKPVASRSRGA